ncbi:hypothetical protein VB780_27580 [Leptolyngbya sp. CCNP1308]|uniref:hypothetical protein n=1 Tax=Leptolyngbya sp. CCNP1308 TaxID=3110255 RepID=UPI002B1EE865|nr:hypothetical protein [Leptolyngbya sp. CCNP1308]MEA5452365.1 hypothetical protein [Leptolyngbya sp. CCNP1308]
MGNPAPIPHDAWTKTVQAFPHPQPSSAASGRAAKEGSSMGQALLVGRACSVHPPVAEGIVVLLEHVLGRSLGLLGYLGAIAVINESIRH